MLNKILKFISLGLIVLISGCVPYHKLSQKEFPQGTDLKNSYDVSKLFIRSQSVYDQFTTLAQFDAIWLSDQTRVAYVEMYCKKRGKNEKAKEAMLARQLEENHHWISFYVLADVREVFNSAMNDKNPVWTPYLKLDKECIEPVSIKEIELEPEYISIFGTKYNSFKTAYLISFPAKNDTTNKMYLDGAKKLNLVTSSVDKSCILQWDLENLTKKISNKKFSGKKIKKTKKDLDFYWG
jgi:hypothetical protein